MEKLRLILAMLFLVEIIVALMHLAVFVFSEEEYPLEFYWIAPIFILINILFAMLITPVLNWIVGCQAD